jgi:nucleotide-binding universal stress UspA family protein
MKILLGVDNSKFAGDIVRAIASQHRTENAEVLVLHVLQPIGPPPPQMDPGYAPELEAERQPAKELVERVAQELRDAGFKASTRIEIGDIREALIDRAAEWQADLIVVGSHGQRGIQRFLLGSVSEFVARHARCSVEIVRTPAAA